jgi:hypothetical protein
MKHHHYLRELAKFASGLIVGDLLALWWFVASGSLPISFLGIEWSRADILPAIIFDVSLFIILVHYGWHIGKTPALRERTFLLIAGTLFGVIALAHLIRAFIGIDIVVLGWAVPLWLSWIGTAVAAYLSYMSFHLALRSK